jgi:hypothetical protein
MSSLHINRFIDAIKAHEARGQRDFVMTLRDAKDLHADITKLLLTLQNVYESSTQQESQEPLDVVVDGGSFKNPS